MQESINILTVNAGSSSIKLSIYSGSTTKSLVLKQHLSLEGLGQGEAQLNWKHGKELDHQTVGEDQNVAIDKLFDKLHEVSKGIKLSAIGHRLVHGGPKYSDSVEITDDVINELQVLVDFDPEHTPAATSLIHRFRQEFSGLPQFASFDTGFFHDLPKIAQMMALPRRYYDDGLRKYGFHGLSYRYLLSKLDSIDKGRAKGKVIFAHLGSGASLAAVSDGEPVDTTMSFTPASGIPMSTRSGDVDPGVVTYLNNRYRVDIHEFNKIVNKESGLKGVSGTSADMYYLLQNQNSDPAAAEAVELFCYQVRKAIGSLATTLGGIDTLVFSGGIGEKSAEIRQRICQNLEFLHIEIDEINNKECKTVISSGFSGVKVYIIPTEESLVIAKDVLGLIDS